jgi:hypothetical protein
MFDPHAYIGAKDDFARGKSDAELALDAMPISAVRHLVERASASHDQLEAADQFQIDERTFRKLYPSYQDCPSNTKAMQNQWRTKFGTEVPSGSQMEECFLDLREAGLVRLVAKEVAKEDEAFIAQRADKVRNDRKANEFNEADAYSCSLEELRSKANGWKW